MEKLVLLPISKAPVKATVIKKQIHEIQKQLATARFAHGDLRENNIFWDSGSGRVVLIDFDWSGEDGIDLYPPFMNPTISWPTGAETNPFSTMHGGSICSLARLKFNMLEISVFNCFLVRLKFVKFRFQLMS